MPSLNRDIANSIGVAVENDVITATGEVAGGVDSAAINDLIDVSLINTTVADLVGNDGGYGQLLTSLGNDTTEWSNLRIPKHTITSNDRLGTTGDISCDDNYLYVCIATNSWKRISWTDSSW